LGDGSPDVQLIRVEAVVTLEGITLTQGRATTGGAIGVSPLGDLTLRGCAVTDSVATLWGGGIDVDEGALRVENSLFRGNSTDASLGLGGGAVSLFTVRPCSFENTTFSGNRQRAVSGFGGGALYVEIADPSQDLLVTVAHGTFARNTDASGRATSILANVLNTLVTVRNSVFADGQDRNLGVHGAGRIDSVGGNVSDDSTRIVLTQAGVPKSVILLDQASDRTQVDPKLGSFNGSLSPLGGHVPEDGSPVLGRAVEPFLPADQRGALRDSDPDAGALEFGATRRLALNEIQTTGSPADFLEFYVLRDSAPYDLSGYGVWLNGALRHVFSTNTPTLVRPGAGVVVADTLIAAVGGTPVQTPEGGIDTLLGLDTAGLLEVRTPGTSGRTILRRTYLGVYADPEDPQNDLDIANKSLTLRPQFRGFAYVPHPVESGTPGGDSDGTPFGSPNAFPSAVDDLVTVGEDERTQITVTLNDVDADGSDRPIIVGLSPLPGGNGNLGSQVTGLGAFIQVVPIQTPTLGTEIQYNPRVSPALQSLSEGYERVDSFYYAIVDEGRGSVDELQGTIGVSPVTVLSPNHRLATGQQVLLEGTGNAAYDGVRSVTVVDADRFSIPVVFAGDPGDGGEWTTVLTHRNGAITTYAGTVGSAPVSVTATAHGLVDNQAIVISGASVAAYNGTHVITRVDANTFTLPVAFAGNATPRGSWAATLSRTPTRRSEAQVTVKVIGANDPPSPWADEVPAEEETLLRILGDPHLLGSTTVFDTDDAYSQVPQLSTVNLLANDDDVDDDDDRTSLRIVGVVSGVSEITAYAGEPGASPVTVTSPGHGLVNNAVILISGYGGHPSYNTFHRITVVNDDTFTLPVLFVDEGAQVPAPGVWAELTDENRLRAVTERGGEVQLEIRTDRIETSMVYNPLPSSYLDALPKDAIGFDSFYYAVEDSHGAVSLAKVTLRVTGRNDDPIPVADPPALALLPAGPSLGVVISNLVTQFQLPSGTLGRANVEVQYLGTAYALDGLWSTDEETPITLLTEDLTSNDFDVDNGDIAQLKVVSVSSPSLFDAAVTLSANGGSILYDPSASDVLDALARGEPVVDGFEVVISDQQGGLVTTWVAVVVSGLNDTPVAVDDAASTPEDTELVVLPLANDIEVDINGVVPDNQLRMIPQPTTLTPLGAELTVTTEELVYDPTVSAYLNTLQQDATVVEIIPYTAADGSLVFANTDYFRVQADGSGYDLDVLANDRNLTGSGGSLSLLEVGTPNRGGSALVAAGNRVSYSPQVNYVGDEVFPYTVTDANGNVDRGIVVVRVEVNALNGNLQAADDAYHVAKGQSPLLAVLANDNILPTPGGHLAITRIVTEPLRDRVVITSTGIQYIQEDAGPFPYDTTFQYEVSGGGVSRAVATVRVTVVDREGTLDARADAFSLPSDTQNIPLDVLANDHILPGTPVILEIAQIARDPDHGTAVIEEGGGRLLYTPNAGFVGRDTLRYLATDRFGGTGFAEVTLMVGTLYTANDIFTVAFDDPGTTEDDDEITVLDVLANDRVLQTDPQTLTIDPASLPTSSLGTLTLGAEGRTLIFDPNVGQVGEEDLTYIVRDGSTPARTAQGRLTLVVIESGVRANPDFYAVEVGSGGNELPVLSNDASIPDRGRRLAIVSVGSGLDAPNRGGTVSITETGDAFLYTPAPGFSGEEVFTYVMTDSRSFDTAKVVVRVTSGALVASEDAFTVFFGTEPDPENPGQLRPVTFSLPLLANDRVIPDLGQLLQITGVGIDDLNADNAPDRAGWAEVSADGTALLYTPRQDMGFPYIEQFTYEISDGTARRTQARVAITVQERTGFRDMQTEDDAYAVLRDSAANVLPVLANDDVKPSGAAGWSITETTPTAFGGVVSLSGRNVLYTPRPNFVGTDTFTYFVSDGVGGTGSALVRVKVGDLSLSPDVFTALSGSADNELDVLANDGLRPEEGLGYLLVGVTDPQHGTASVLNARVLYTPSASWSGGYPYDDTFEYIVEDDSGLEVRAAVQVTVYELGSDRDDANVTITVVGVNDAPTITGTRSGLEVYHRGTIRPFATVTLNDPDEVPNPDPLTLRIVISDPTHGYLTGTSGVPLPQTNGEYLFMGTDEQLTALIRTLVFVPTTGDPSRVAPGVSEETRFTIYLSDPYVTVVDDTTTVIARHAEVTRLTASDGSSADEFGFSVGASRKLVVAGAPFDDDAMIQGSGNKTGSSYLYARDAGGANAWGEASKIVALQRDIGDEFGYATDVNEGGNLVAVGARKARPSGVTTGAAWIFRRSGDDWVEEARLVAPGLASGDEYGYSVALNGAGDVLVVGSPKHRPPSANRTGAAFVFTRNAANQTWTFVARLNPTDGATDDDFGRSVSVNGSVIVVGSPRHSPTNKKSGAMYAYRQQTPGGSWTLASKLRSASGDNGDEFGHSVAVYGGWLAAGARLDEANGKKSGTVYLFQQSTTNPNLWTERRMLQSPTSGIDDEYGFSVDLDGQFLAVGARRESIAGRRAGALYVHSRDEGGAAQWGLVERLIPGSVDRDDEFGYSVALRQGVVAVGARRQQLDGRRFGATYVYQLRYNNAPLAVGQIDRLIANVEEAFEYFLPAGLFADTDVGDSLVGRQLTLADGSELPGWLAFDDVQGRLYSDTPPTTFDVGVLELRLTAFDEDGSGANLDFELEVVVSPGFAPSLVNAPSPALAWSLSHAGGTPMPAASASLDFLAAWVDPDGDGRSNLEEYAQGTDPFLADTLDARAGIEVHLTSDGAVELQFQRRGNDPRMVCVVEGSADLLHWQALSGGLEQQRQPVSAAMETVRVVYVGQGSGEFLFFRVRMDYR
jgi:VCBS repeat-containing protein